MKTDYEDCRADSTAPSNDIVSVAFHGLTAKEKVTPWNKAGLRSVGSYSIAQYSSVPLLSLSFRMAKLLAVRHF